MIDMHIHSRRSDGSDSLEAIAMFYISRGFKYIGITDHDRVIDYNEIRKAYRGQDLHIVPGVEISSFDYASNRKVHLLGYFIRDKMVLKNLLGRVTVSRREVAKHIIGAMSRDGYPIRHIDVMKVAGTGGIYKQHILYYLQKKGYKSLSEDIFRPGGKYYYPVDYVDYREAIEAIKDAGGIAILAHPGECKIYDLIPKLVLDGLDGIQVMHPSHTDKDVTKSLEMAKKHSLLKFTGSDNHGKYGPRPIDFESLRLEADMELKLASYLEEKIKNEYTEAI